MACAWPAQGDGRPLFWVRVWGLTSPAQKLPHVSETTSSCNESPKGDGPAIQLLPPADQWPVAARVWSEHALCLLTAGAPGSRLPPHVSGARWHRLEVRLTRESLAPRPACSPGRGSRCPDTFPAAREARLPSSVFMRDHGHLRVTCLRSSCVRVGSVPGHQAWAHPAGESASPGPAGARREVLPAPQGEAGGQADLTRGLCCKCV